MRDFKKERKEKNKTKTRREEEEEEEQASVCRPASGDGEPAAPDCRSSGAELKANMIREDMKVSSHHTFLISGSAS